MGRKRTHTSAGKTGRLGGGFDRLPDAHDLGSADGAGALRGRLTVFQRHRFGILDLALLPTFNTVRFHWLAPLPIMNRQEYHEYSLLRAHLQALRC